MRIAEYEELWLLGGDYMLEILEVNGIVAVFKTQGVLHHTALVAFDNGAERCVDRRHNHHGITFLGEIIHAKRNAFHDTGHKTELFARKSEIVTVQFPVYDRLPVAVVRLRIAEHGTRVSR